MRRLQLAAGSVQSKGIAKKRRGRGSAKFGSSEHAKQMYAAAFPTIPS